MHDVLAGYDEIGTKCVGQAQQGTINLSHAVRERWQSPSLGVYACRNKRGRTSKSAHAEGRAYDHAWHDEDSGFQIGDTLIHNCADLGIQVVIWWDHIWSWTHRNEGWRVYDGDDNHHGHLHIEQNWSGAWWLQYADAVHAIASHLPHPKPPVEEDYMLPRVVHWNGAIFLVGYDPDAGEPWRRTFPNPSRLAQVVGGGGCVTDHGNAFEVTNNQFEQVYADRGAA